MNRFQIILVQCICIITLFIIGCNDDDNSILADLHYDSANDDAPTFDAGSYEAGAKFTPDVTADYVGKNLERVEFYLEETPDTCEVRIYSGAGSSPDMLLYSADVTNGLSTNSWNSHNLTQSVTVTDNFWICVVFKLDERKATVGCDAGPANDNGDLTYSSVDGQWFALRTRTGNSVNINWNIRGHVAE